jgi:hypothetical protein
MDESLSLVEITAQKYEAIARKHNVPEDKIALAIKELNTNFGCEDCVLWKVLGGTE